MTLYIRILLSAITLIAAIAAQHATPQYIAQPIPDLCNNGPVDSAATITLPDGSSKMFISSGNNFWLLNMTGELPSEANVQHLPYSFQPDIALIRDSTGCPPTGGRKLALIEMKNSWSKQSLTWNLLEGWIDGDDLNWSSVQKFAECEKGSKHCTITDKYFSRMAFDWNRKLDSAFGVIGETAFFFQDKKVYQVDYLKRCLENSYRDIIIHDGHPVGTSTTGAMSYPNEDGNQTIVLFDYDMHYSFNTSSLNDINFDEWPISSGALWKTNRENFFDQCPKTDSLFEFMSFDMFSASSKHFSQRPMVIFIVAVVAIFVLIVALILGTAILRKTRRGSPSGVYEVNEEGLMADSGDSKVDSSNGGNKENKTFLQTSC